MLLILEARDLATGVISRVRNALGALSGPQKILAAGLAAAAVGGVAAAYELGKFADHSVKAAASFQQANTLLVTQAGVAQNRIKGLGDTFLQLAPKLAQTPQALSEAFYHVASAGVPAAQQLAALKAAAQGAAIGNANLEDTTNALVATMRSGIGGVHGARDAMATLLAIVGTGNMRLQDFVSAMGTGLPGAAKAFGVSLQSAGAPLAYLADTGMHAENAATRLGMAMALLGGPSQHASKVLGSLGLTSDQIKSKFAVVSQMLQKAGVSTSQLAADMRRPDGLVVALEDLKSRMDQAGLSAQTQAAVITAAFGGGKSDKAIMQMFESLPKVAQKFAAINASVSSFGAHWQATTQTAIFQAHSLHGATSAISTAIGQALLPAVQKLLSAIVPLVSRIADWVTHHKTLAAIILGSAIAIAVVTAAIGMLGLAMIAFEFVSAPVILIVLAIVAALFLLGYVIYEIVKHWKAIAAFFGEVWREIKHLFEEGIDFVKRHWKDFVLALLQIVPFAGIAALIATHWAQVKKDTQQAWDDILGYLTTVWNRIAAFGEMIWGDFRGWLGTLWGDIRADLFTAWSDVTAFFQNLWQGILNDARTGWAAIKDFFAGIGTGITSGLTDGWNAVAGFFSGLGSTVAGGITGAANWLYNLGSQAISGMWDGMKAGWDAVSNWVASTGGRVVNAVQNAANWLYQTGRDALTGLWNGMKDLWNAVGGWLAAAGGRVVGAVGSAVRWLYNAGSDAITGFWNGVKDVWQQVSTWLGRVDSMTEQWFKSALTWLYNAGKQIVEGLWNGIKGAWGGFENWFKSKLDGLKSLAHSILGILSPSRVFADIGQNIMLGLQQGLAQGFPVAQAQLQVSAGRLIDTGASLSVGGIGASSGGGNTITVQLPNATFWGQPSAADVDALVNQIGTRLAQFILPGAGIAVRRG